ncbi:Rieske (2Fe-2S) protein [Marinifilum sp. RC60d5]|uniref:Rieske (2Fe-2S) protein n=1 Tax=Marinifilum sp. RC60d5 TaxID=3458414 RepID=UPI00403726A0
MNVNKSNLLYFFLLLPLSIIFCSCSSNSVDVNEIVPYRKIDVTLDLNYHNQLTNNTALYFDNVYGELVGYKNHGIIIYRANEEYFVYDATCPHDVESSEHVVLNDPDDDDSWEGVAVCPVCNSQFMILTGANPIGESVAIYPLKSYRTSLNGNMLHIYN